MASISLSWTQMNNKSTGSQVGRLETNELYTNIKMVADGVSGSTWSWSSRFPVSAGDIVTYDHLKELRDATDRADDSNVCNHRTDLGDHGDNSNYSDHSWGTSNSDRSNWSYDSGQWRGNMGDYGNQTDQSDYVGVF